MKKAPRSSAKKPAPITDPLLAALLSFIDGARRDDDDGRFAELYGSALAAADRLLTSQPITSAFEMLRDRPTLHEEVSASIDADIQNWTNHKDTRRAFMAVQAAWREESDDPVDPRHITEMMPAYIEHAVYLGACLMYRFLKGGVR
jgi:hypothetical protein